MNKIIRAFILYGAFLSAALLSAGLGTFILAFRKDPLIQAFAWMVWAFLLIGSFVFAFSLAKKPEAPKDEIVAFLKGVYDKEGGHHV